MSNPYLLGSGRNGCWQRRLGLHGSNVDRVCAACGEGDPNNRRRAMSGQMHLFQPPPDPPTPKAAAPPAEGTKARRHEGTKGKTPPRPSVPPCLNASVPPTRKRRLPGIDKRPGLCLGCNENAEQCTCSEGEGERDKGTEGPRGEG